MKAGVKRGLVLTNGDSGEECVSGENPEKKRNKPKGGCDKFVVGLSQVLSAEHSTAGDKGKNDAF
jgi:hypothetical protein